MEVESAPNLNWTVDYFLKNKERCLNILKENSNLNLIPSLNFVSLHNITDGQLVRYRGMVQDMMNPEFYYENYEIVNGDTGSKTCFSGLYRDTTPCQENEAISPDSEDLNLKERIPLFCIPIPGTNHWVTASESKSSSVSAEQSAKQTSSRKRALEDEDMDVESSTSDSTVQKNKRNSSTRSEESAQSITFNSDNYFPLPNSKGVPCIVKVYENVDSIVLNDRIEVIGFVSLSPDLEATWESADDEDKIHHPPPSVVPRLHAITVNKLKHINPFVSSSLSFDTMAADCEKIRTDLHLALTQVLFGDTLAADYLICHLISTIYVKKEYLKLGQFSLNLSSIKHEGYAEQLYSIIQLLIPQSHYLPLSIQYLNTTRFVPKKDYSTNKLLSGLLQLSDDTELFIDETKLEEGQLNDPGCRNMAALHTLVMQQQVGYDFQYYQVNYDTNIPVLIISEGKSLIPVDVHVKVKVDATTVDTINETFDAAKFFLTTELLNKIRILLTSMRHCDLNMEDDIMRFIEQDFVKMRQEDSRVSQDDLHKLLVLSRLLSLSNGKKTLSLCAWNMARRMETERKQRLV